MKLLEGLRGRTFEDPYDRGALERYFQLAAECVLDVGEMVIALRGLPKAESYRDVIRILGEAHAIEPTFARDLAPLASLRNLLVHDYERIDPQRLVAYLAKLDEFRRFGREIARFLGA